MALASPRPEPDVPVAHHHLAIGDRYPPCPLPLRRHPLDQRCRTPRDGWQREPVTSRRRSGDRARVLRQGQQRLDHAWVLARQQGQKVETRPHTCVVSVGI